MNNRLGVKSSCLAILTALSISAANASSELTVAFIGDQGTGDNARAVLQLVEDEGADLLLIQGDLGYDRGASAEWIANIDGILGEKFPVLLTVGNHENYEWPAYRQWLVQRIQDVPELNCQGDPGVKAHCSFRGVSIVQVAPGVDEVDGVAASDDYANYLDSQFSNTSNVWRICSWHKNQKSMQVGVKSDATGWDVYSACLKNGGIVATAHEHSYSRTFLMNDFKSHVVAHRNDLLEIRPGSSFAFVSGLGGKAIREQKLFGDWWASVYSANQNASHGALFCTLTDNRAICRFKDIAGAVPDQFVLENHNIPGGEFVLNDTAAGVESLPDDIVAGIEPVPDLTAGIEAVPDDIIAAFEPVPDDNASGIELLPSGNTGTSTGKVSLLVIVVLTLLTFHRMIAGYRQSA